MVPNALIRNIVSTYLIIGVCSSLVAQNGAQTIGGSAGNKLCPASCLCGMGTSLHIKGYYSTVDCRNRKLVQFPYDLLPSDTTVLLLRGNAIPSFEPPPEFNRLSNLRDMDLSYNRISMLDMSALNSTSLKVLILSFNSLKVFTNSYAIGTAKNLEILQLTSNRISTLERGCFVGLDNLQRLSLTGNRLSSLDTDAFDGLRSLRELNLDRSQIAQINDLTFRALSNLEVLTLSFNEITNLPRNAFSGLVHLQHLNLAGNRFEIFSSDALTVFQNLKSLNFDSNPVRKLLRQNLKSFGVQEISISFMDALELIDREAFYDMRKLIVINMHDNPKLSYIDPSAILNCYKITALYLHNNSLVTFSRSILDSVPELRDVTLTGNTLRCDCHTEWLMKRIGNNNNTRPHIRVDDEVNFCQNNKTTGNSAGTGPVGRSSLNTYYRDSLKRNASALWTSIHVTNESRDVEFDTDVNADFELHNNSSVMDSVGSYSGSHCPPVVFPFYNETIYHELGTTLVMDCRSIGAPLPHVHWVFFSRKVINNTSNYSRLRLDLRGTLTVEHVKQTDAGRYTCIASNDAGMDEATTMLRVFSPTARVLCQTVGANFITVAWSGTDSTIASVQYIIVYRRSGSNTSMTSSSPEEQRYGKIQLRPYMRSYWIVNLQPLSVYELCMAYETNANTFVKIDCSHVQTKSDVTMANEDGIYRVASRTVLAAILVTCSAPITLFVLVALLRRYHRRKSYAEPYDLRRSVDGELRPMTSSSASRRLDVKTLAHIPLDNLYHLPSTPLDTLYHLPSTPLTTSRTSLIS